MRRTRALVLAYFLAAALLHPLLISQQGAAAALPTSVAGNLAVDGINADKGIDHFLVLVAVFVVCLFR